jgi:hypothetical protein
MLKPVWNVVMLFLEKKKKTLNMQIPYDPEIAILNIYSREMKIVFKQKNCQNIHSGIMCNGSK